ncbi:MAG TPA: rhodanese-like domain-containing protein [Clostridiales bacterium]|nr:rhodanese-like domain-containing protein [Clostridiales bacterium]
MATFHKRYDINKVNINEVNNILGVNEYLIDLRSNNEFKEGRLPNSINVPFLKIGDWAKNNIDNYNAKIYLYCQNGARSVHAAAILKKMGYTKVVDLGGLNAYKGEMITDGNNKRKQIKDG